MNVATLGIAESQLQKAITDIWAGLNAWRLWTLFGYNDVKMKYRRSTLGPFWASLSMAGQVFVTGFVMAYLFHMTLQRYLPYICIGLIVWSFLTTIISEGATAFISSAELILQVKRPLFIYLLQVVWQILLLARTRLSSFSSSRSCSDYSPARPICWRSQVSLFSCSTASGLPVWLASCRRAFATYP